MRKIIKFTPQFMLITLFGLTACTPTVQLETPKEGITINMNVVVDHKINVEMDDKTKQVLEK
ncbi:MULTISPECIES: YnbE family lipoprotein [unclassified Lonepinella]|uniref:YnbE family lipoprotein n=1 Tax=unclassified Lonepinella TaxID=2642006 RepID=UPI0036D90696